LYTNGVLCHVRDRQLRILDLDHSPDTEIVVDLCKLLRNAIPEFQRNLERKFQLLYQANGIVSCLYTQAGPSLARWLVVFQPSEGRVITARRINSDYNMFVRNNAEFVYYGVQSEVGNDGFRRWVLRGFNIANGQWLPNNLDLPDTVGSEIDETICFEIIDGYFCALSNETWFENDRIDYTSYYDFFRFPLDRPSRKFMERPTRRNLFRRQHSEGAIDDRWTFMKIFSDELTSELKIVESRKEWLSSNSSVATRTYYTKTLHITEFGERARDLHGSDVGEDDGQYVEDDPLAQSLGTSPEGGKGKAPKRDPSDVHVGDDATNTLMVTRSKCSVLSYHPSSQAFLDLLDDPPEYNPSEQRIRIRVGTRLPRAGSELKRHSLSIGMGASGHDQGGVISWPPEARSQALDSLRHVMNPPGYVGNVHSTWDQRSLVYATGGRASGGLTALVLVSFDPGIQLKGARSFFDGNSTLPHEKDLATISRGTRESLDLDQAKYSERAGNGSSAASGGSGSTSQRCSQPAVGVQPTSWASTQPAQHLAIGLGYHFAK
jgi:hypothetical protein